MKSMITAVALALACFTAHATEQPSLSFKGIELGVSHVADVMAKFPHADELASAIYARPKGIPEVIGQEYRIGETSAGDFTFLPVDDVIERITASFTSSSFRAVRDALTVKYGEPTEVKQTQVKNLRGAVLESTDIVWKHRQGEIRISERAGSLDKMALYMSTTKMVEKSAEDYKKGVQDAAVKGL